VQRRLPRQTRATQKPIPPRTGAQPTYRWRPTPRSGRISIPRWVS
jgi:hypothetical protein